MMFTVALLLFVSVSQLPVLNSKSVGFDSSPFCQHDPRVEAFATTYFTATVVQHGCDVVSGVEVTGAEAAKSEYNVLLDILQNEGMCNADWVAYTCAWPFRHLARVSATDYLEKSSHSVGKVFLNHGFFDCNSSISLALDLFSLSRNAFRGLDEHKFESYQRANVQALVDIIKNHGFDAGEVINDLAYSFYNSFSESHQGNCTTPKN